MKYNFTKLKKNGFGKVQNDAFLFVQRKGNETIEDEESEKELGGY